MYSDFERISKFSGSLNKTEQTDGLANPGGGSLQAVLAARHGSYVGQRVLASPFDKTNGSTRQFSIPLESAHRG
ncbi:hypothetical protein Y032_0030g2179 [Ancylostoma ceylanicum]|uniref:Uncharacterized protein n=1 Tax=Ancylostoma ceylanicum TaxID=53326 RepID=A0A016UR25_9BILA|nr:hypothetical protein Y032_0030g2179 [Ancylostoma ceylanicum]